MGFAATGLFVVVLTVICWVLWFYCTCSCVGLCFRVIGCCFIGDYGVFVGLRWLLVLLFGLLQVWVWVLMCLVVSLGGSVIAGWMRWLFIVGGFGLLWLVAGWKFVVWGFGFVALVWCCMHASYYLWFRFGFVFVLIVLFCN